MHPSEARPPRPLIAISLRTPAAARSMATPVPRVGADDARSSADNVGWEPRPRSVTARVTFREEGGDIEFDRLGTLTSPVAIAAFEGWNDAGEAASGVISHLGIAWQAQPIAAIEPEDFYDFQVTRPVVEITGGRIERLVWPTTRLSVARAGALAQAPAATDGTADGPGRTWPEHAAGRST